VTLTSASRLGPLREAPFRRFFVAQQISQLGDKVTPIALSFAVLAIDGSPASLGFVLAAYFVPNVALMALAGVWSDRLSRRMIIVSTHLVRCTTQALMAALLLSGHATIGELMVIQALNGAAAAFFRPATRGLVPQVVSRERRQQANALFYFSLSVSTFTGPALAGLLVATTGAAAAILFDAITFGVAAALVAGLPDLGHRSRETIAGFWEDLAGGWRLVAARTWLWVAILNFSMYQLVVLGSLYVLGPTVARASLGGAAAWSAIVAALGVGTLAGSAAAYRVRPSRPLVVGFAMQSVSAVTLALLAIPAPVPAIVLAEVGSGIMLGLFGTLWETVLQEEIPGEALSRVGALDSLGSAAPRPLGMVLAGLLATSLGTRPVLLGAAVLLVVWTTAILALPSVRGLRSTPAAPESAPAAADG
jgi:MFS family permease